MKMKFLVGLLATTIAMSTLTGCTHSLGNKDNGIPYPENYYFPKLEEVEIEENTSEAKEEVNETKDEESGDSDMVVEIIRKAIHFFLDTSGSMNRSPEVIKIHSAATKCAAGYDERHFYGIDSEHNLTETTEQLALSGKYGNGAPLDQIENGTLPYDPTGVNVITTDLQSNTNCTELGRWLVDTGCSGYSFYVFNMKYDGSLEFEMYTSNSTLETVSINNCSFDKKEFLMVVFGDNALVEGYDRFFQSKIDAEVKYDMCHVSLHDTSENLDSFFQLNSSKYFTDDIANVDFTNTNFVYGLSLLEDEETEFTCNNTFVYKKGKFSTNKAKEAVKAILYAIPDVPVPNVQDVIVSHVMEYNKETGCYEDSKVMFQAEAQAYLDGFPSVADDSDPEAYERLNKALGGAIVPAGPVFTVTVQNESLPKGLYAVEVQVIFEATGEVVDLQKFAASHTAGLEEYSEALKNECVARVIDGQESTSRFTYTGDATNSIFRKLLEFERVTDELIAAGAVTESNNEMITLRLIIDNR